MKPMNRTAYLSAAVLLCLALILSSPAVAAEGNIQLLKPSLTSNVSIEQALAQRRSVRSYTDTPLSIAELSQLLWAAQGITASEKGFRTAPSGLAKYPLRVYVICFNVAGTAQGVYRYEPKPHELIRMSTGDVRGQLKRDPAVEEKLRAMGITAHKDPMLTAQAAIVITGDKGIARTPESFYLEAGHAAQNVLLQCVSLGMGSVPTAGFKADTINALLGLGEQEVPIYVLPVGKK